jgi:hypothetical protein
MRIARCYMPKDGNIESSSDLMFLSVITEMSRRTHWRAKERGTSSGIATEGVLVGTARRCPMIRHRLHRRHFQ